jgi:hypothetical protein
MDTLTTDQKVADLKVRKAHQDRRITLLLAKRNRMSSAVTLHRDLRTASGDRISIQTVRNRLHASGLHASPGVMPTGLYVVFDLYSLQMNLGSA